MPSARQPSAALADRAERHVFAALPALSAVERRALALAELTDLPRTAAARDTGLSEADFATALAHARKVLRRARAPLAGGGRCERAELLASARLDAPLPRERRKWLEIHLARCPRCTEHLALLDEARTELRVTFLAEPPQLPPAPEPPALEATEPVAQLRVVPEPAPDPDPAPASDVSSPTGIKRSPRVEGPAPPPPAPAPPTPSPPRTPAPVATRPRRELPPAAKRAAAIVAVLLLIAAAVAGISALGDDTPRSAPWDAPDAPEVRPPPLIDQ